MHRRRILHFAFAAAGALLAACSHAQGAPESRPGAAPTAKGPAEHIVVISLDGCRPDAIGKAEAPTLQGLIKAGASCPKAITIRPSVTLPSHTSMLTGLDFKRHGVTWNDYKPGHIEHPTVFAAAKKAGHSTAMLFSKDKFNFLVIPNSVDFLFGIPPHGRNYAETSAAGLGKTFAKEWPEKRFALTFIHMREPDEAGHQQGWMGPEYIKAVGEADKGVAAVVETLKKSGDWEKTALIVTADHGGSGKSHGEDRPENNTIPWICVGPGVKPGLTIDRVIHTYDTAPTALAFIGVAAPEGIDGKAVEEVLGK